MGNYMDKPSASEIPKIIQQQLPKVTPITPITSDDLEDITDMDIEHAVDDNYLTEDEPDDSSENESERDELVSDEYLGNNICFYLFQFRESMAIKDRQCLKWATSKLFLTEGLIRAQHKQLKKIEEEVPDVIDLDEYITDEDESENNTANNGTRYRRKQIVMLERELSYLQIYSNKLKDLIMDVAKTKQFKRKKEKKVKRSKRRTLISSKKPSNKKRKLDMPSLDMPLLTTSEEDNKENYCVEVNF